MDHQPRPGVRAKKKARDRLIRLAASHPGWVLAHNQEAKRAGGVRIVACFLPVKSPWLNPIEPKWAHGKKAIVEPERLLSADEVLL